MFRPKWGGQNKDDQVVLTNSHEVEIQLRVHWVFVHLVGLAPFWISQYQARPKGDLESDAVNSHLFSVLGF